jgi:Gamma-glutamyl cyclotransferase, AIG2-like
VYGGVLQNRLFSFRENPGSYGNAAAAELETMADWQCGESERSRLAIFPRREVDLASGQPAISGSNTLQYESVQIATFGRQLDGHDDAMPGWRKDMLEITDAEVIRKSGERFHPMVRPLNDPIDEVSGKVSSITAEELAAADRYEVSDYRRIKVTLRSGVSGWVYVKA